MALGLTQGGGPQNIFKKKKVKNYIIQYHKLIITVHTAVADKKRSKELSSYVIVHIWLSSVRVYVSGRCEAISKTDQKKNLLLKASSFLCGGVCTYICISVVNVNLSGLFFLSPTRITLKTERLGIGEPCGGWVVGGLVDSNHGGLSPCPHRVHQNLPF